ncbi:MAG TPA: hypothetical protein VGR35_23710 [Tepidisphaeraceae bacterium]|nr:hypothetical protein [Tepidisphaeraceae bacterium]
MPLDVVIPTASHHRANQLPLRVKVELLAQCRLHNRDPREVVPPVYQQHRLTPPRFPGQALSGFATLFKNLVAQGNVEAIGLAKEYGFELRRGAAEPDGPSAQSTI